MSYYGGQDDAGGFYAPRGYGDNDDESRNSRNNNYTMPGAGYGGPYAGHGEGPSQGSYGSHGGQPGHYQDNGPYHG
ncbi:hypothetical protein EC988_007193, partial [Linderina pennispora]